MRKYIFANKANISIYVFFSLIVWMIRLINPYIFGNFIDEITKQKNIDIIKKISLMLAILLIIEVISSYICNIICNKLKAKISFALNYDIIEYAKRFPFKFFLNTDSVYLSRKINLDSNIVTNFIIEGCFNLFTNMVSSIVVIFLLINLNKNVLIFIVINILLYVILYKVFKKKLNNSIYLYKEDLNIFSSKIVQQFSYIKLIKLNSWNREIGERLKIAFGNFYNSLMEFTRVSYLYSTIDLSSTRLFNILLIFYGGIEIVNNKLTIGELTIINSYFSLVLGSLSFMLNFTRTYQDSLVSYNRIVEILETPQENIGQVYIEKIREVTLNNLTYMLNDKIIVDNFNYNFSSGNIYTIIGKNGAGKSTIINILVGLINDYSGTVKYNDISINDLDMFNLKKSKISIVEQEAALLNESIYYNLTVGNEKINKDLLLEMAEKLNLFNNIDSLDEKLEIIINDKSSNISGGEKQKVALIRTLLKTSDLIILDEPSSALDNSSTDYLINFLNKLKKDKIIIVITHDPKLIDSCDYLVKIE